MAKIKLFAFSKQCLYWRIGDIKTFSKEVCAWAGQRNQKKDARDELGKFYRSIKN
jgi:hypothetical protein